MSPLRNPTLIRWKIYVSWVILAVKSIPSSRNKGILWKQISFVCKPKNNYVLANTNFVAVTWTNSRWTDQMRPYQGWRCSILIFMYIKRKLIPYMRKSNNLWLSLSVLWKSPYRAGFFGSEQWNSWPSIILRWFATDGTIWSRIRILSQVYFTIIILSKWNEK